MKEQVIALSGGVGGAKLVLGLSSVLEKDELLVVANTGDDFEHLGFPVCPDIDTLLYTLGGICNTETGWGRAEETWSFMNTLKKEDPEQAWFQLGDKDIETHNYRKKALAAGNTLTEVTADLVRQFRITPTVVPMSDFPVRTWVLTGTETGNNWMPFQEYFVKHQCKPRIYGIEYRGSQQASVPLQLDMALTSDSIRAVIICPSNPFLSIDPIMAVPGMVDLLRSCGAPV
ncbi:MAG: 2-phospho-L-lactate transferase, partial [Deltaproteobacteria bacterium]|nr:2-phospho-L-lactate transferase [Deltaproteobacteria bacterium]